MRVSVSVSVSMSVSVSVSVGVVLAPGTFSLKREPVRLLVYYSRIGALAPSANTPLLSTHDCITVVEPFRHR